MSLQTYNLKSKTACLLKYSKYLFFTTVKLSTFKLKPVIKNFNLSTIYNSITAFFSITCKLWVYTGMFGTGPFGITIHTLKQIYFFSTKGYSSIS